MKFCLKMFLSAFKNNIENFTSSNVPRKNTDDNILLNGESFRRDAMTCVKEQADRGSRKMCVIFWKERIKEQEEALEAEPAHV